MNHFATVTFGLNRRRFLQSIVAVAGLGLASGCGILPPPAQSSARVPRIGYLDLGPPSSPYYAAFRGGMRDLGYVEDQTVVIEARFAEGRLERLAELATELIRLNVDVIFAVSGIAVQVAKDASKAIPIVTGYSGDLVEAGFVESLARPGGNITGVSFFSSELAGKRLELLKATVPPVLRVAVLTNPDHPGERIDWRETQAGARNLGLVLDRVTVRAPSDFDDAFARITAARPDALFVIPDVIMLGNRARIAEFASQARLPMMAAWSEFTKAGGLMSYGPDLPDGFRRAAVFVDKILKGAKPMDLPIERPTRFGLTINLKTAQGLGLIIPQAVMQQASEAIQ
jgi:putative ABC transport system substrate-binding protein